MQVLGRELVIREAIILVSRDSLVITFLPLTWGSCTKWLLFIFSKKCQITRCSFLFIQINLSKINIKLSTITYVISVFSCPVWRTAPINLCLLCIPGSSVSGSPFMGLWGTRPKVSREFYFSFAGLRWIISINADSVFPRPLR